MYQVRKVFTFEAAHVLEASYSEDCQNLHGHHYVCEIFLEAEELNPNGMVVDFKRIKEMVQPIIDELDHSVILTTTQTETFDENLARKEFVMPKNTTAENLAETIFSHLKRHLFRVSKVRIHETPTGYAEYWEE